MRTAFLIVAGMAAWCTPALAQQAPDTQATPPPYLDDRSDPAAVVRSFYNAISRSEYARAWGYFGETKPSPDFETFARGYETTGAVFVATGIPGVEGAAGSTYYSLPVSILAFAKDGTERSFAGCYTLRLAQPAIQGPPFTGLLIEKAELKPVEAPYEEQLPASCGVAPAETVDLPLEAARKLFVASQQQRCSAIRPDGMLTAEPDAYEIKYRGTSDAAEDPDRLARLFRFFCGNGAYNESHVYLLWTQDDGVRLLSFATPDLDVRYEGGDSEAKVEHVGIKGYLAATELVNSFYDETAHTLTSAPKWRGVGDASSSGVWLFRDGDFTLIRYEVDASYDGEINPETVLDFDTAP